MLHTYLLYLESGPQKKSTLVHVIELLGCVHFARTTDEAIAETPDAIRAYLRYLKRHGEDVDPTERFSARVAEHITEGDFLGHGSPQAFYGPDREPLTPKELERDCRWLEWSRADLLALVRGIDDRRMRAKPAQGRSIAEILRHVLEPDPAYLSNSLGPTKDVSAPVNAAMRGDLPVSEALRRSREAAIARLRATTPEERRLVRQKPSSTGTVRRSIRRMLGHEWEHRREIAARLGREA